MEWERIFSGKRRLKQHKSTRTHTHTHSLHQQTQWNGTAQYLLTIYFKLMLPIVETMQRVWYSANLIPFATNHIWCKPNHHAFAFACHKKYMERSALTPLFFAGPETLPIPSWLQEKKRANFPRWPACGPTTSTATAKRFSFSGTSILVLVKREMWTNYLSRSMAQQKRIFEYSLEMRVGWKGPVHFMPLPSVLGNLHSVCVCEM